MHPYPMPISNSYKTRGCCKPMNEVTIIFWSVVVWFCIDIFFAGIARRKRLREAIKPPRPRPETVDAGEASTAEQRKGGLI
jgi:hypothetical protein